ncbi:MAG TPA: class I SAM-dependent methyltransferase [Azospirillaceae bacterium]|nr:class I SAM-dependent methyltransferase [Azospirillaceae bacterium]
MGSIRYFLGSIAKAPWPARYACGNCGGTGTILIWKKLVTQLRRCGGCGMLFRTPTDSPDENRYRYNTTYRQGFTTTLPDAGSLAALVATGFAETEKDYARYIGVLAALGLKPGARLFDFGCSWGYGSWQLARAGFDVTAYEIGQVRRDYAATQLGVRTVADFDAFVAFAPSPFDCFFSAHVIEHVPSPSGIFGKAFRLLRPGGLFVAIVPNGCAAHRAANPRWNQLWGEVHPNFIDDAFLEGQFPGSRKLLASSPFEIGPIDGYGLPPGGTARGQLAGDELLFVAVKDGPAW